MISIISKIFPVAQHSLSYNRSIDGLRGIAVGVVLIFHIWPEYFSFGYVGVDIFFVLSGYLITQIIHKKLQKGDFSFREFYRNRVRRIFPSMLFVTFCVLGIGWLFLMPGEFEQVARHVKSSALFYQNFRLMSESGYWDTAAHLKPLLHYWSLSIEEQYYLLWPALVIGIYRLKKDFFWSLLAVTLFLMVLPHLLSVDLFFHSLSRFWELSFGGLTYAAAAKYKEKININRYQWAVIAFFIAGIAVCQGTDSYSTYKIIILILSTSLVVFLVSLNPQHRLFSFYPLVFLGLISYPLYLWHFVIISYMHIVGISVVKNGFYVLIASVAVSYFTYRFLEHYTRSRSSYKFSFFLVILALCLALTAQYVRRNDGLPERPHISLNNYYESQFKKPVITNQQGKELISGTLGFMPENEFMKATDTDRSKEYILLIGDSHAFSAYHGLAEEFSKEGYETVLFANQGCPPVINGGFGTDLKETQKCAKRIENVYTYIKKASYVSKVIFASRGPVNLYQKGYDIERVNVRWYSEYFENKDDYDHNRLFFEKIEETFAFFDKLDTEFYYVLENPELGYHPRRCSERPFGLPSSDCTVSYSSYLQRMLPYREKITEMSAGYSVNMLDPEEAFCDGEYCYGVREGRMLYRDSNHLSLDGSKHQASFLADQIFSR